MTQRHDTLSQNRRSKLMSRVRAKDTKPELLVRKVLTKQGFRYRLHRTDLPGKPDVVIPRLGVALFVHGCFWHRHTCPKGTTMPQDNGEFWRTKLARNVERDMRNQNALRQLGWKVVVVWECEMRDPDRLPRLLRNLLEVE